MILNIPPTLSQIRGVGAMSFIGDGSALASSSKSQIYADGNAGNVTVAVPTGKAIKLGVAGSEVGRFDAGGITSTVAFQLSNIAASLPSGISYLAHSTNLVLNCSSGYISLRNAGTERMRVADTYTYVPPGLLQLGTTASGIVNGSSTTGSVAVSGGGTIGSGGTVICYGSAHATNPGQIGIAGPIVFTGAGAASSTLTSLWADASAGNLFVNVPTGKYEQIRANGVGLLSLNRYSNVQSEAAWALGAFAANSGLDITKSGVMSSGGNMFLNVASGLSYAFDFAGVEKYRLSSALAEMDRLSLGGTIGSSVDGGAGSLALTNRIQFAGAGTASSVLTSLWADASAGNLITNVPSSKYVELRIAGYTTYTFGYSNNLATTGANVFQIGDGSGSYIQSDGSGLLHRVSNTYAHTFKVNTTDVGYFDGNGLTVTKNIVSSNNSNTGGRTANLDVQRYYNNVFWGWPNSAYTCSMGSFDGAGYPFICFYGYHSSTTNTIKRSSASNQPVWFQSLSGYISIFQGSSGTADVDCTGTEKYRFGASLLETSAASFGGTIGSSSDPGAGGIYAAGNINFRGGQKCGVAIKTTTYTATSADYIILGNHASTPFTINLPTATGSGQIFIIKNINTAAVTVDANASETIDGSLTQVLAVNNSITIVDYATGLWAIV